MNVHNTKTADDVLIVPGLLVRTNDWTVGVVIRDSNTVSCCGNGTHHGQKKGGDGRTWFTDHDAAEKYDCNSFCRHDHWFDVKFDDGSTKQYNGERLGARNLQGVKEGAFALWMWHVDQSFINRYGFDSGTMEDWTWRDAFDDGLTPASAIRSYLDYLGEGDF